MTEKSRRNLDQGGICSALFTDLVHSYLIYIYIYIYIYDLFLFLGDDSIASYADDTTPYAMKENSLQVLNEIKD